MKKGKDKLEIVMIVAIVLGVVTVMMLFMSFILMVAWNVVADNFDFARLNFWASFALITLASMLTSLFHKTS